MDLEALKKRKTTNSLPREEQETILENLKKCTSIEAVMKIIAKLHNDDPNLLDKYLGRFSKIFSLIFKDQNKKGFSSWRWKEVAEFFNLNTTSNLFAQFKPPGILLPTALTDRIKLRLEDTVNSHPSIQEGTEPTKNYYINDVVNINNNISIRLL